MCPIPSGDSTIPARNSVTKNQSFALLLDVRLSIQSKAAAFRSGLSAVQQTLLSSFLQHAQLPAEATYHLADWFGFVVRAAH